MSRPIAGARPLFPEEDLPGLLNEIGAVLRGGRLILGPKTKELEALWAARVGVKHAVAVSSCTAALEIAYRHAKVDGREVIVPTNTFVATANAAVNAGAKVVFADMDARDYGVDVDDVLAKMTDRTAVVVVVHIAGIVSPEVSRLADACRQRGVRLVEDCAHAHGATLDGREAGSFGDVGCFSFYPTKVITCGAGGVITTNDEELAAFARSIRHHGQGASLEEITEAGNDFLLDEVRATIAISQVRRLDDFLARRRAVAARYDSLLAGDARFTLPTLPAGSKPAWYKYPVLLPEGVDRDGLRRALYEEHQLEFGSLYSPPCHLMPVFQRTLGTKNGSLPKAEAALARQICPPMHAAVELEDAPRVVDALRDTLPRFC
ncbi:MAG TPA: DegT/DnrJ/EryC1/StrS family aminotransferase [Byssovorax sp.]|jgi:dTDP-4-amino-4,6-dideoxygalactose transaminase